MQQGSTTPGYKMSNSTELLQKYVDCISMQIEATEPPWFLPAGTNCRFHVQQIISGSDSAGFHKDVVKAVGDEPLSSFYAGCFGSGPPPIDVCVSSYLWDKVPDFCELTAGEKYAVNRTELLAELERYRDIISGGDVEIVTSLRLANVDISGNFDLAEGIRVQKISADDLRQKYPVNTDIHGVSRFAADTWFDHCVEVLFIRRGKGKEIEEMDRHVHHEAMVNIVVDAFQLSGLQSEIHAVITHYRCDTPLRWRCDTRSVNLFRKPTLLTDEHIAKLREAHRLLSNLESDEVLRTAVDRFLLGLNRTSHHPRRMHEPNWDKIVDYVIAMESLFVNAPAELSYRLSLNGSSVIHLALGADRRAVFRALKILYDLRSKIVHGRSADFIKPAMKFLEALGRRTPSHESVFSTYNKLRDKV